jgi:hypothetical protein
MNRIGDTGGYADNPRGSCGETLHVALRGRGIMLWQASPVD